MARKVTKENEGFYKVLPRRLRELMAEHDGTHDDLSAILGVQRQTVTNYCNGVSAPSWESLIQIADYFNVSVDYLLGRTDAKRLDDPDVRAVCDYLGLSGKAVEILHTESHDKDVISALSRFLDADEDKLHRFGWQLAKAISLYRADYVSRRSSHLSSRLIRPFFSYFPDEMHSDIESGLKTWGGELLERAEAAEYYASQAANTVRDMVLDAALGRAALNVRLHNDYSDIEVYEE